MIEFQVNALPGINPLDFIFMKLYSKRLQTLQNVSVLIPSILYHYHNNVTKKTLNSVVR